MQKVQEKKMSEQATGCLQQGEIIFYDEEGYQISLDEAIIILQNNHIIEVPAAGAGSYREIFEALGFEEVKTIDTTSSAGDWIIGVKNEYGWFVVNQENRYPYYGFRYLMSNDSISCSTFELLFEKLRMI